MSSNPWQLSVVIPIYNEADNLSTLAAEITDTLHAIPHEILFVDDGSTDHTENAFTALAKTYPCAKLIRHSKNYGQSAALLTGVRAAQYPWIVTLDGDNQNNPRDILSLLSVLDHPNPSQHFAVGLRKRRQDHVIRKLTSRIGNGIRQTVLGDGCPDTGCSLKCFPRQAFLQLPHFNHMHRFLPALFQRAELTMHMVWVDHRPRAHGVSKYGVRNRLFVGLIDLFGLIWLIRRPCHPQLSQPHDSAPI